ncbi:hypothetical protein ScPMuIL_005474 [Solemya velum]
MDSTISISSEHSVLEPDVASVKSGESSNFLQNTNVTSVKPRPRRGNSIKRLQQSLCTEGEIIAAINKYFLFIFNFISWVIAAATVGIGYWTTVDKGQIVRDATDFFLDPSIILCLVGSITFTVAFCGCVGALRENTFLLKFFYISLFVVLVVEFTGGTLIFIFFKFPKIREKMRTPPETFLKQAIIRYRDDPDIEERLDFIQRELKCCGISFTDEGYKDWQLNMYFNCSPSNPSSERCAVPESCCILERGDRMNIMCGYGTTNKTKDEVDNRIFTRGCVRGFAEWLDAHEQIIVIMTSCVLATQILGVISAKALAVKVEKARCRSRNFRRRPRPE